MSPEQAYNQWAAQYDTNANRTRDLEAGALRAALADVPAADVLEIGCGTGKNSGWLAARARRLVAVDFSAEMLARARAKVMAPHAAFVRADINAPWDFTDQPFDLVTFSLVLEHIENLDFVFGQARQKLRPGGRLYLGELHPFKQYSGSQARFDTAVGPTLVQCFSHHVSDFVLAARRHGLAVADVQEWFDDGDRTALPRILALVFTAVG